VAGPDTGAASGTESARGRGRPVPWAHAVSDGRGERGWLRWAGLLGRSVGRERGRETGRGKEGGAARTEREAGWRGRSRPRCCAAGPRGGEVKRAGSAGVLGRGMAEQEWEAGRGSEAEQAGGLGRKRSRGKKKEMAGPAGEKVGGPNSAEENSLGRKIGLGPQKLF
jgi:hypothetical protein